VNRRTRLRQLFIASLASWTTVAALTGFLTYDAVPIVQWSLMLAMTGIAALVSVLTLNQSQLELTESNKSHSRTKRQVQESQLKIDRYEYDAKKSGELRRIVLNSTQEKDHSLRNMASALDHSMDEILDLTQAHEIGSLDQIRTRAEGMKRYADDLQALAKLELKSDLPNFQELNFLNELHSLIENWTQFGKSRKVKVKLDNPEDQMPISSDANWLENLLSRLAHALIRMNENTVLNMHLIGYMDAELGDALRISFSIDGRLLTDAQLKRVMTEYISIIEEGQEIGPGLTFVVARRVAQMLHGFVEVSNGTHGVEVLVVIPRNPNLEEKEEPF